MFIVRMLGVTLLSVMLLLSPVACKKEGTGEKAGKKIDKTIKKTNKAIKKTGKKIADFGKKLKRSTD